MDCIRKYAHCASNLAAGKICPLTAVGLSAPQRQTFYESAVRAGSARHFNKIESRTRLRSIESRNAPKAEEWEAYYFVVISS